MTTRFTRLAVALAFGLGAVACDDNGAGPNDSADVTVGFSMAAGSASLDGAVAQSLTAANEIVLTGTNGSLEITDVAFIVGELKLEGATAVCGSDDDDLDDDDLDDDDLDDDDLDDDDLDDDDLDDDDLDDDDDCEEFETGLYFVELPLTGGLTPIVAATVPAGTYTELKLEVEDADLDEAEDDDDGDRIAQLIADIEAAGYTDWPEDASLVVAGTFTPTAGEPRPFVAYFEAEIKVELELDPPLVIEGESGTVDIVIDPAAWFTQLDGTVIDLSAFDYTTTGEVLEFEAKFEDGFTKIELEGFDDD